MYNADCARCVSVFMYRVFRQFPSQWNPVSNLRRESPNREMFDLGMGVYVLCVDRSVHRGVSVSFYLFVLLEHSTTRGEVKYTPVFGCFLYFYTAR